MIVNIVQFQTTKVALLEHRGPAERLQDTVAKFIAWRKASGLSPIKTSRTFGIPHSDPNSVAPEQFRWDVCGSIETDVPANAFGVKTAAIPGGRCAVIRHQGSHKQLDASIHAFYRQWLPHSGEEIRGYPCFFHYINFIHEVGESDLLTDIYFPLK